MPTYEGLLRENRELRELVEQQQAQIAELQRVVHEQHQLIAQQQQTIARQERRIAELEGQIEELRRQGKRQAAPFSKGDPKAEPRKSGRKPGTRYGRQAVRAAPERVDETVDVGCPVCCPHCSGPVRLEDKDSQYQIDLPPVEPRVTEFIVHWGRCERCGRRVQGRHPQQVSDAVQVGRVHFGPGVLALTAYLNKVGGLSYGKIAALFGEWMRLSVSRSALCRALGRLAEKSQPTYQALVGRLRGSPVVYPDETGWRVGGRSAWLWVFTNLRETVYAIRTGRGFVEAASILGEQYSGTLVADGWAPYRCFEQADLQTCLAHLLRRCHEMLQTAKAGAVRFPRAVKDLLQRALGLRDRRELGQITDHGLRVLTGRLSAEMSRLLDGHFTNAANGRLARHLQRHEENLFLFLLDPSIEATNWPAEQAIRPAVANRKSVGGNRTPKGAQTQATLMTLLRTGHQKGIGAHELFTPILCGPLQAPQTILLQ